MGGLGRLAQWGGASEEDSREGRGQPRQLTGWIGGGPRAPGRSGGRVRCRDRRAMDEPSLLRRRGLQVRPCAGGDLSLFKMVAGKLRQGRGAL